MKQTVAVGKKYDVLAVWRPVPAKVRGAVVGE
jgi:hypothetical protein